MHDDFRTATAIEHDADFLKQVAQVFNHTYAKTRFIMGGPEVQEHGKVLGLRAHFQPYNDAHVDSLSIWIEGDHAKVQVAGSTPGTDVESQGFQHASANATVNVANMDAAKLAHFAFELSKKMS